MKLFLCGSLILFFSNSLHAAEPKVELTNKLKQSVVKVHVATHAGGHGVGTGVVIDKDLVVTNCHVLAGSNGVSITKYGENFAPVGLRADWKHDLCLLRFEYLTVNPVELGDSENLKYEQFVFAIGFPGGPPKPQTTWGNIKALYPLDDSQIIRTNASFVMGASGSPLFDESGKLVGINTFKSPGRDAFYYNMPVKWVKRLKDLPETPLVKDGEAAFWDAPADQRPDFMQVVLPYQSKQWQVLGNVASKWLAKEPNNIEALFYQSIAYERLGNKDEAKKGFEQVLAANNLHTGALFELGAMANKAGNQAELNARILALKNIDADLVEEFNDTIHPASNDSAKPAGAESTALSKSLAPSNVPAQSRAPAL